MPAFPLWRTVVQADGTSLRIMLRGDETMHYFVTTDQLPVLPASDGSYRYAALADGRLTPSPRLAHDPSLRSSDERGHVAAAVRPLLADISALHSRRVAERNAVRRRRLPAAKTRAALPADPYAAANPYTGKKRGLVILMNFKDVKMKTSDAATAFDTMFNEHGYSANRHIGSVADYFHDQSYGQLTIDFDIAGPYTAQNVMSYYGRDNGSEGNDAHAGDLIREACAAADKDVDFKDYDWDGDGSVDQVYVVYAGYSQAAGAEPGTIWPHEWTLTDATGTALRLDGVTVDTYACSAELYGTSGTRMDGIGTACHEFSHCLGLPDLYDTNYVAFGMSYWSVLDAGAYNGPSNAYAGSVPAAYTAEERMEVGWLRPVELDAGTCVTDMPAVTDAPVAYIIRNRADADEYYLLQNVQQRSWNSCAAGHGLLVLHIDYDKTAWQENTVNDVASHQRVTVVAADNRLGDSSSYDLAGDPYPGVSNNTALTDTSAPAATLYAPNDDGRKFLGRPIDQIAETGGLVSFRFNGGVSLSVPAIDTPVATGEDWMEVSWAPSDGAAAYDLEVTQRADPEAESVLLLSEDFAAFDGVTDMLTDYAAKLDDVLHDKGWTGAKVFAGAGSGAKIGSAKYAGQLTTPLFALPASGAISATFTLHAYDTSAPQVSVALIDDTGRTLDIRSVSGEGAQSVTFADVACPVRVRFATSGEVKRVYIDDVAVYDGRSTAPTAAAEPSATRYHQVISGITATSYRLEHLPAAQVYTLRLRSTSALGESPWCEPVTVALQGADAIAAPHSAARQVDVYTLSGRKVRTAAPQQWARGLAPGIYVLRGEGGSEKIVIR